MSYLVFPGTKKSISYISLIRNEVENYFDINIMSYEQYKIKRNSLIKSTRLAKLNSHTDHKRGHARKYFCYLAVLYTGKTHEEIGNFLKVRSTTVTFHVNTMKFRTIQEEYIISQLSARIKKVTVGVWKSQFVD